MLKVRTWMGIAVCSDSSPLTSVHWTDGKYQNHLNLLPPLTPLDPPVQRLLLSCLFCPRRKRTNTIIKWNESLQKTSKDFLHNRKLQVPGQFRQWKQWPQEFHRGQFWGLHFLLFLHLDNEIVDNFTREFFFFFCFWKQRPILHWNFFFFFIPDSSYGWISLFGYFPN